jgi:hypothetical protein
VPGVLADIKKPLLPSNKYILFAEIWGLSRFFCLRVSSEASYHLDVKDLHIKKLGVSNLERKNVLA